MAVNVLISTISRLPSVISYRCTKRLGRKTQTIWKIARKVLIPFQKLSRNYRITNNPRNKSVFTFTRLVTALMEPWGVIFYIHMNLMKFQSQMIMRNLKNLNSLRSGKRLRILSTLNQSSPIQKDLGRRSLISLIFTKNTAYPYPKISKDFQSLYKLQPNSKNYLNQWS